MKFLLVTFIFLNSCSWEWAYSEEEQACYDQEPPYDTCMDDSIILYDDEATFKNNECYFKYTIIPCNIDTWEKCAINSHTDDYCLEL